MIRAYARRRTRHVESVPVKETFQGKTVWEGIVEVFDSLGHPTAQRGFMLGRTIRTTQATQSHVTVLHIKPLLSPQTAVRAAIVQEFREHAEAKR